MRTRYRLLWVLLTMVSAPGARAHQELYHNMEVDLSAFEETGVVAVSFIIHAPELLVDPSEAARAMYDGRWLRNRGEVELEHLVSLGRLYLADRFVLRFEEGAPLDLAGEARFGNPDELRSGEERGLSPACIEARLELDPPPGVNTLRVDHAADSEKRLMVVVERPGDFPAAIDVEPGTSAQVKFSPQEAGQDPGNAAEELGADRTAPILPFVLPGVIGGVIAVLLGWLTLSPKRRRNPE